MRQCRLLKQEVRYDGGGRMLDCIILDPRWALESQAAMGRFNLEDAYWLRAGAGTSTEGIEVLKYFMDAASIPFYLSGGVAGSWGGSFKGWLDGTSMEAALSELCKQNGWVFCYRWDGFVEITYEHEGPQPPNDARVMQFERTYSAPPIPEYIAVIPDPTLFTCDVPLLAVGYELQRSGLPDYDDIRALNQLSYAPKNGGVWDYPNFNNVSNPAGRELARKTIFRLYRAVKDWGTLQIQTPATQPGPKNKNQGPWYDPKDFQIAVSADAYSRIVAEVAETKPTILGYWWTGGTLNQNNVQPAFLPNARTLVDENFFAAKPIEDYRNDTALSRTVNNDSFTFDSRRHIFEFDKPKILVPRNNAGIINAPLTNQAWMVARMQFALARVFDRELLRQVVYFATRSPAAVPGYVYSLRAPTYSTIAPNKPDRARETTNPAVFRRDLAFYAESYLKSLRATESATITMKGFAYDVNVNGMVSGVRFDRSPSGQCTTTLEYGHETPLFSPMLSEKEIASANKAYELRFVQNARLLETLYRQSTL